MEQVFHYGEDHLTIGITLDIIKGKIKGILSENTKSRIAKSHLDVHTIAQGEDSVYGINTGFGPLCTSKISSTETALLQYKILQSHSVGMGKHVPLEVAKTMLVTKVHALAQGFSGVNLKTLERIIWHIDHDVIPAVPEKGSVGASGDLAPLSHLFLPLIGLGEVYVNNELRDMTEVLREKDLLPIELGPKEGLALINGTQFILSFAVKTVARLKNALDTADIVGAMSLEGMMGSARPFLSELHTIRPYKGNQLVAHRLRTLLDDSEILNSHVDCDRVQDPYSLRCMPPVHGASRNAWLHLKEMTEIELNSVTDNPIVLDAENSISGGNFHGQPMALPLDYATLAAAELGNIADRRCYLMLEGRYGLPKLLMKDVGLNSGFMIPQYTTAALVTENKTLCFPASADSVPTSLGQEDHVSMGSISGRKANQVLSNLERIFAVELMYAAQALDFRRPLKSTPIIEGVHELVREHVDFASEDRIFSKDQEALSKIIKDGTLVDTANYIAETQEINLNGEYDELFGIY